jgi:hypothetical protein
MIEPSKINRKLLQKGIKRARTATLDWIKNKLREQNDARLVFDDVDKALDFYNETHPDGQVNLSAKPQLNDFYQPSVEHNYYELFVATIGDGVAGYVAYKFLTK